MALESEANLARMDDLLKGRTGQPYSYHSWLAKKDGYRKYSLDHALNLLRRANNGAMIASAEGKVTGVACWSLLPWDSEQLGFPAAKVDLLAWLGSYTQARKTSTELVHKVIEQARHRGIRHMTARVDAGDFPAIHALQEQGFELIDGILTMALQANQTVPMSAHPFEVRLFKERDLTSVLEIARASYVYDRFHADSAIRPEIADAINEQWIRNSCRGVSADAVVIVAESDQILGYATCKLDRTALDTLGALFGSIVMVATAAHARKRGVARAATTAAVQWLRTRGAHTVEVGTQLRNIRASRLYEQSGFRLVATSLTFRKLL